MASVPGRKPRILILHNMRDYESGHGFATPIIDWYEELGRRKVIEPQVVGLRKNSKDVNPPLEAVRRGHVDGIVAVALVSEQYLGELAAFKIPMVVLDYEPLMKIADSVAFDNVAAARQLGCVIAGLGHRDILYVSRFIPDFNPVANANSRIEATASLERRGGLMLGCEGTSATLWGMLPWHSFGGVTSSTGADGMTDARLHFKKMIEQAGRPPDCIVTVDHAVADDMLVLTRELGLRIPEDVSMATFQVNPFFADHPETLKISHMSMDYRLMADEGWRLLSARMQKSGRAAQIQNKRLGSTWLDHGSVRDRSKRPGK